MKAWFHKHIFFRKIELFAYLDFGLLNVRIQVDFQPHLFIFSWSEAIKTSLASILLHNSF